MPAAPLETWQNHSVFGKSKHDRVLAIHAYKMFFGRTTLFVILTAPLGKLSFLNHDCLLMII